jgi:hypothetical protein
MTDKTDRKLLEQALTTIEAAISTLEAANEQGKITDTIWVSEFETLFDFLGSEADALRAALAEDDVKQEIEAVLARPVYTAPQQREWKVLTKDEMQKHAETHLVYQVETPEMSGVIDLIRAVSEKLKEKNT